MHDKKILQEYEVDDMCDMNLIAKAVMNILAKIKRGKLPVRIWIAVFYQEEEDSPFVGDVL